jgi:hypothetical protein
MRIITSIALPLLALAASAGGARSQGMPTSQPGVLTIIVEELKPGVDAEHEANEAGWPIAFSKAGSQFYYLAFEAMTGTPEIWFVAPYRSWTAEAQSMKETTDNPTLAAELTRLARADGPFLAGKRTIQAIARPDLSYGTFPDLAMVRFYEVSTFRIRPGHDQAFENAAKVYAEQVKKGAPGMSYRMYQVTGGMPGGTYLVFSATNSYDEFDKQLAQSQAMWSQTTPQDMATLQKTMSDDVLSTITQRYRVSPTMSYVSAEAKAKDPQFWSRPRS